MAYILNTPFSSREIYLNSDDAERKVGNDTSFCVFSFNNVAQVNDNINILLSVVDAQIPVSFTNVNSNNNTFVYKISNTIVSVSLAVGNYTVNSLRDGLNLLLNGIFTFTYDSIKNKFTITHASTDFTLELNTGLLRVLGFTIANHQSSLSIITSDSVADLSGLGGIFISTNFLTTSQDSKSKNLTSILQKIPITQQGNGVVFFTNKTGYKTQIFEKNISEIHIKLLDEEQNLLDMQNARWRITLGLDFVYQEKLRDAESRQQLLQRLPQRKKTFLMNKKISTD